MEGDWERRIVDLADGRSVGEIIAIIYGEELKAGAWMVDIGIWSDLFARSVITVINELADRGYIQLRGAGSR